MESEATKIKVTKELPARKWTFEIEKHPAYGLHKISGFGFTSPNDDGTLIKQLMSKLPEGQRITLTVVLLDGEHA